MNDPTNTKCIVVADDESGTRTLLAKVLRRQGYEVLEASDGEEALSLAISRPVDLLLCDLQMPRMRGEELGRWVDQLDADVQVVLMTAYPSYEAAVAAVRCHAADFLEKPFRSLELVVESVARALRRREANVARRARASTVDQRDRIDELKRRYVGGVAQDVRTPLGMVRSLASMLERGEAGPLTAAQRSTLGHLRDEAETLAHEVDKLTSIARLESGDFQPRLEAVPVAEILAQTARAMHARAEARGVHLRIEAPAADVAVMADARDAPMALLALAENAVKFTGDGGSVLVRAALTRHGVRFDVVDTGIGIDPADQSRIFDLFEQVENPLTRRSRGCGVGLAVAAKIADAHGTRILLASEPGEGSMFSFVLPRAAEFATEACATLGVAGAGSRSDRA
ncbi:MAG: hybrid sensor histidine kinase/response regulator [Planctomycetes bacterium]|nr:hybrid sensor histidine kinase/response regulator [Planctomycetota bacterium]